MTYEDLKKIRYLASRHISWRYTAPPDWLPPQCAVWWLGEELLCVPLEWVGELERSGEDPYLLAGLLVIVPADVVARGWRLDLGSMLLIAEHVHFHRDRGVWWVGMPPDNICDLEMV
jgi:hypothetical protein